MCLTCFFIMKSWISLSVVCLLAIAYAENESDSAKLSFTEYAKNSEILSPEYLKALYEKIERSNSGIQTYSEPIEAVVNDYVDKLLTQLDEYIIDHDKDTLELPDINEKFEYPQSSNKSISFESELNLTHGVFNGLSTIFRSGDVDIEYGDKVLTLLVPAGLKSIAINFDYLAEVQSFEREGGVTADVSETAFTFGIALDFNEYNVSLTTFEIDKIGSIKLHFTGHVLIDWLASLLIDIVLPLFNHLIRTILQNDVQGIIQNVIDSINAALEKGLSGGEANSTLLYNEIMRSL